MVNTINTAALICEFNPFHYGHKYIIEYIKSNIADRVICIMSGNFVQRGDISILNKYDKTEAALKYGADAVIELPAVYANSNAETFAQSGVALAKAMNCDCLCFGTENCSVNDIRDYLDLTLNDNFKNELKKALAQGKSYPGAISQSLENINPALLKVVNDPNNLLAIEYVKACSKQDLTPVSIKRINVRHDSDKPIGNMASASYIRKLILENNDEYRKYTPLTVDNPADIKRLENTIVYKLKCLSLDDISKLPEITEGLENRIFNSINEYNSLDDILSDIKTKRYTLSKIRRIIISAFLGINDSMQKTNCPYIRVLGIKKDYRFNFASAKLPIIVNLKKDREKLDEISKSILDIDINSGKIYPLSQKDNTELINDYNYGLIKS